MRTALLLVLTVGFDAFAGQLAFTAAPTSAVAGQPFHVTVEIRDDQGHRIETATDAVTLSSGESTSAVAGIATFNAVSITKAATGSQLVASATGHTSATSAAFDIAPARAAALAFAVEPTTIEAGHPFVPPVVVEIRDAFGNRATQATDEVTFTFTTNPGGAFLKGTTRVAAIAGRATFSNLTLDAPGKNYVLDARSGGLALGYSKPFDVTGFDATALFIITEPPERIIAGETLPPFTVEARNRAGAVVTHFTGTIDLVIRAFDSIDRPIVASASASAIAGVATFPSLTIEHAGNCTIAASSTGLADGSARGFQVLAAHATHFDIELAATVNAGYDVSLFAIARDQFGNVDPRFDSVVTLTTSDPAVVLPFTPLRFKAGYLGEVRLIFRTAGPQTVTLTEPGLITATDTTEVTGANAGEPPVVTIVEPSDGQSVWGPAVRIHVVTSGASRLSLKVGESQFVLSAGEELAYVWDTMHVPLGQHTITAYASDSAGNSATESITVNVKNECGCSTGPGPLMLLALLSLAQRRRTRQELV